MIDSMRLLLWDTDKRSYSFYVEVSVDQQNWHIVADERKEFCRSWQYLKFDRQPVVFIRIVGTYNSANEVFHCVHFECPAQVSEGIEEVVNKTKIETTEDDEIGTLFESTVNKIDLDSNENQIKLN